CFCFFFSSRRRHTRFSRDWSSDVCSSDLYLDTQPLAVEVVQYVEQAEWTTVGQTVRHKVHRPRHIGGSRHDKLLWLVALDAPSRSEERRVGKECRSRRSPYQ